MNNFIIVTWIVAASTLMFISIPIATPALIFCEISLSDKKEAEDTILKIITLGFYNNPWIFSNKGHKESHKVDRKLLNKAGPEDTLEEKS